MGWYGETIIGNIGNPPHPVGQKAPNQFGLHDMHGNISEFCMDEYDEGF
jgi:formylglycine-generating enzyme required for sulfatase activity